MVRKQRHKNSKLPQPNARHRKSVSRVRARNLRATATVIATGDATVVRMDSNPAPRTGTVLKNAIMIREAKKIRDSRSRSSVLAIMKALGHAMSAVPVDSVIAAGTTLLQSQTHQ